jgi:vacuolar-type H+-ATPase subunit I/STV1
LSYGGGYPRYNNRFRKPRLGNFRVLLLFVGIGMSLINGGFATVSAIPVIGNLIGSVFQMGGTLGILAVCMILFFTSYSKGAGGFLGILLEALTLSQPVITFVTMTLPGIDAFANIPAGFVYLLIDITALSLCYGGK